MLCNHTRFQQLDATIQTMPMLVDTYRIETQKINSQIKIQRKNTAQQTILPRAIATAAVRQYWPECDRAQSFLYPTARRVMQHEAAQAAVRSLALPVPSTLLPGLLAERVWRSTWLWLEVRQAVRDEWRRSVEIKGEI